MTLSRGARVGPYTIMDLVCGAVTRFTVDAAVESYQISRDGRFLIDSQIAEQATTSPITLVVNWKP